MFVEFHDLNDAVIMVNFGTIFYIAPHHEIGSILQFPDGHTLRVKESVQDVRMNLMQMAMQSQIKGH